jgi:deoxyhypusine synthase
MEYQDKENFLKLALKDSLGNLQVKTYLDDILDKPVVTGHDMSEPNKTIDWFENGLLTTGIQASVLHKAITITRKMFDWKLEDQDREKCKYDDDDLQDFHKNKALIFLGCSSNLMTSGTREVLKYLLKYRMVHVFVTPAGGIEEDLIRTFGDYKIGNFGESAPEGYEKQGNLLVPLDAQQKFRVWVMERFRELHLIQDIEKNVVATPSSIIKYLGEKINDESSCLYWAAKNEIQVFSPALTDGYIGECLVDYNLEHPGFIIDAALDIHNIDKIPHRAKCTGALIFGAGIVKHHILNANLMRNGADYAVIVNTGSEWEASDSGAKLNEALSWGKLRLDCEFAKIYGEANVIAPILIAAALRDKEKYRRDLEWKEYVAKNKRR